jgi:hypothetical protein
VLLENLYFVICLLLLSILQIWTPCAQEPSLVSGGVSGPEISDYLQIMSENQQRMRRPREIGL